MRIATLLSPVAGVILLLSNAMASASCASLRDEIADRIEANGVPAGQYTLTIRNMADSDAVDGKIVGHCEGNTRQIVYRRQPADSMADEMRSPESTHRSEVQPPEVSNDADDDNTPSTSSPDTGPPDNGSPSTESPDDDRSEPYNPIEQRLHDLNLERRSGN